MPVRLAAKTAIVAFSLFASPILALDSNRPDGTVVIAQYQLLDVAPSGSDIVVEQDEPANSVSEPYIWTLSVADGAAAMSGDAPAIAFQRYFSARLQSELADDTVVRDGAPDGFVSDALAALDALSLMTNGTAGANEGGWYIQGILAPGREPEDVLNILANASTTPELWRIAVTEAAVKPATDPRADAEMAPQSDVVQSGTVDASMGEAAEPNVPPVMTAPAYNFSAVRDDDGLITLDGNAPASLLQELLSAGDMPVQIDTLTTNPHAPDNFATAVRAGLKALNLLETGQVVLRDGVWLLSGTAAIDTVRDEALALLAEESSETEWKTLIIAPSALDICRDSVEQYMADKAVLFPSAGTTPTSASLDLLPGLAERLAICPGAAVYVEGHTDADGGADANLALSIRRAEAVVDALVALGVDPARLYAVGYGASLPIASNATAEGKRQNRRIVFRFEDIATPVP